MKQISVDELKQAVEGELYLGASDAVVCSVSIDTRRIEQSAAFFALSGERYDAHDFLEQAVAAGATTLVVERVSPETQNLGKQHERVSVIVVKDVLVALQQLAAWYRQQLKIHVVGITGSNGKTSTKDFTRDVLSQKFKVNATKGNYNNHIGLPLTVLDTEEEHEVCVWEMGMNHPGEIAPLCEIAQPDDGVITNIGTAHIEYMGSREAIAQEKGALGRSLPAKGKLFLPAECDFVTTLSEETRGETVLVGGKSSQCRAENLQINSASSVFDLVIVGEAPQRIELPVLGRHMVTNALLAAGVGHSLGMSAKEIARGLAGTELTSGRLRVFESRGVRVLDDTYNANLESVLAALHTVAEQTNSGAKRVVLGAMAELGAFTEQSHRAVGERAASLGLQVMSVGDKAQYITASCLEQGGVAEHYDSIEQAALKLSEVVNTGDVVLFKGSRSAGMERVMEKVFLESEGRKK